MTAEAKTSLFGGLPPAGSEAATATPAAPAKEKKKKASLGLAPAAPAPAPAEEKVDLAALPAGKELTTENVPSKVPHAEMCVCGDCPNLSAEENKAKREQYLAGRPAQHKVDAPADLPPGTHQAKVTDIAPNGTVTVAVEKTPEKAAAISAAINAELAKGKESAPPPANRNLYDLAAEFLSLQARLDAIGQIQEAAIRQGEWDRLEAEVIKLAQRLDKNDADLDKKIEGWAKFLKQLEGDEKAAREEAARLAARADANAKARESMKVSLCNVMDAIGKPKVKTPLYTVYTQANGASIEVLDAGYIPNKFIKPPAPAEERVDRKALLEAIKRNEVQVPTGVKLIEDKRHLRIL